MARDAEREAQDAAFIRGAKQAPRVTAEQEREALDRRQVDQTRKLLAEKGAGAGGREAEKKFGKSAMASREAQEAQRQLKVRKAAGNRQRDLRERSQADTTVKGRQGSREKMIAAEQARKTAGRESHSR